jgi:hypothetical protein
MLKSFQIFFVNCGAGRCGYGKRGTRSPKAGSEGESGGTGVGARWRRIATLAGLATPQSPLGAAVRRKLPHRERKYPLFLGLVSLCQREGRQFESGLVLHMQNELVTRSVAGSFCIQSLKLVLVWTLSIKST